MKTLENLKEKTLAYKKKQRKMIPSSQSIFGPFGTNRNNVPACASVTNNLTMPLNTKATVAAGLLYRCKNSRSGACLSSKFWCCFATSSSCGPWIDLQSVRVRALVRLPTHDALVVVRENQFFGTYTGQQSDPSKTLRLPSPWVAQQPKCCRLQTFGCLEPPTGLAQLRCAAKFLLACKPSVCSRRFAAEGLHGPLHSEAVQGPRVTGTPFRQSFAVQPKVCVQKRSFCKQATPCFAKLSVLQLAKNERTKPWLYESEDSLRGPSFASAFALLCVTVASRAWFVKALAVRTDDRLARYSESIIRPNGKCAPEKSFQGAAPQSRARAANSFGFPRLSQSEVPASGVGRRLCRLPLVNPIFAGVSYKRLLHNPKLSPFPVGRADHLGGLTKPKVLCLGRSQFMVKSYKDGVDPNTKEALNPEVVMRPLVGVSNQPESTAPNKSSAFVQAGRQLSTKADEQETRTIVITSGKGGVGKTTTTANLGMSIARLGYRVALIDADIGLRNLDLLLGLENRVLYTAMDIFEGDCRLDQALIRDKRLKNLCLLAISKNRQRYNVTRQKMDTLIASISALGYHFILIDCPAGIDIGFINAISPAQEALIVTTPEITAMRDADRVAGLLEANGIYNAKLLINRVRPDMIQRHDMMSVQDVQDVLGIPLLGAIPEDLNVIISTNRGEPLVLRKKLTLSGIAFENAARRLIGRSDYLIDLKTPYKGLFQKMKTLFFNNQ